MNTIREIQALNKRELEANVSTEASWHTDYRDTAYIYIGGLPFDLSEGDVITIFSQFGEPTYINLIRDKETGKSKGFAFLKYEDQRSTDLAVDNLGGATIMGRVLKVDHTRYKKKDEDDGIDLSTPIGAEGAENAESESEGERRPLLKEERELAALIHDHDEDDPMKEYLIKEKQKTEGTGISTITVTIISIDHEDEAIRLTWTKSAGESISLTGETREDQEALKPGQTRLQRQLNCTLKRPCANCLLSMLRYSEERSRARQAMVVLACPPTFEEATRYYEWTCVYYLYRWSVAASLRYLYQKFLKRTKSWGLSFPEMVYNQTKSLAIMDELEPEPRESKRFLFM